jgi:flagellar basal body-associated protein FliL
MRLLLILTLFILSSISLADVVVTESTPHSAFSDGYYYLDVAPITVKLRRTEPHEQDVYAQAIFAIGIKDKALAEVVGSKSKEIHRGLGALVSSWSSARYAKKDAKATLEEAGARVVRQLLKLRSDDPSVVVYAKTLLVA